MTLDARLSRLIIGFAEMLWSLGVTCPGNPITHTGVMLIIRRVQTLPHRLRAIIESLRDGTYRPPAPRGPRGPNGKPRPPTLAWPQRMPNHHAWLVRMSRPFFAHGSYLEQFLRDPEMQALIQAAPQLRRLFRPICRMLGVTVLKELPPQPTQAEDRIACRHAHHRPPRHTQPDRPTPTTTPSSSSHHFQNRLIAAGTNPCPYFVPLSKRPAS